MVVAVLRATYMEQTALETFFTELFGRGTSRVIVSFHQTARDAHNSRRRLNQDLVETWTLSMQDS
jgi:hypothetical protein